MYTCKACSKNLKSKSVLIRHLRRVHLKRYQCNKCSKSFGQKYELDMHMKNIHEQITDFQCSKCNKSFGTESHLRAHSHTHDEHKKFQCDIHLSFRDTSLEIFLAITHLFLRGFNCTQKSSDLICWIELK